MVFFFNTKKAPQNTSPVVSSQPHHDRYVIRTARDHSRAINFVLIDGDITRQNFPDNTHGAIFNAANAQLRAGGGVCGAIFHAAGHRLTEECNRIGHCPTGNAVITGGGNLRPIRIIHAVGPQGVNPRQLSSTYQATLRVADNNQITHISIPSISTGIYGYDVRNATPVAINAIIDYLQQNQNTQLHEIRLINSGEERMNIYRDVLNNHEQINPS